ncbi:MAG: outer membrane beta-barrel domain-containing protein [Pseudomonadales bacterium]|nr:outer membrane beta-barrel domain-containing protein [Pseudomonadales bacterium]
MENWHQRFFLASCINIVTASLCFWLPAAHAQRIEPEDPLTGNQEIKLVPKQERRKINIADIDNENFEIGLAAGLLSVEDFETNVLLVATLTYHVTEDFFVEARFGQSELGKTSFDKLSGGAKLLSSDDQDLLFYDLSIGLNIFPGEAFILDRWAVNSSFYFIAGIGSTDFAGNQEFTINGGIGYRILANDFLSLNFHVRDHIFETEITGDKKNTHNFEVSAGLSIFF